MSRSHLIAPAHRPHSAAPVRAGDARRIYAPTCINLLAARCARDLVAHPLRERGSRQLCHGLARSSPDHRGGDDLVTALACLRSSQSSQHVAGVTPDGEALRLLWLIHAWRWFSRYPSTTDQPRSVDQPRKCGGSGRGACCGAESEAGGAQPPARWGQGHTHAIRGAPRNGAPGAGGRCGGLTGQ